MKNFFIFFPGMEAQNQQNHGFTEVLTVKWSILFKRSRPGEKVNESCSDGKYFVTIIFHSYICAGKY